MTTTYYVSSVAKEAEITRLTRSLVRLDEGGRWSSPLAFGCRAEIDRLRLQLGKPVIEWRA